MSVSSGRLYLLGCDTGDGIDLEGSDVLARHARLCTHETGVVIEPVGEAPVSLNGQPITIPTRLRDGDWLALGETLFQVHLPDSEFTRPPTARPRPPGPGKTQAPGDIVTIGRDPHCDHTIDSPLVSREHARLIGEGGAIYVEDLKSTNGTFVNGQRLTGRAQVRPGDRVAIATFAFVFTGEALEPIDETGRVHVEVRGLYKAVPDRASGGVKHLLDQVSLVFEPGEFAVIFGTSGSGKSTLLDALNGRRPATGGQVLYNGTDLYASFDLFRAAIGYVPQQDIVHRKIRVSRALYYTARLRLPPDTTDEEIEAHIHRVLDKVGLAEKADLPIDTPAPLSGGQLKRVSLAVELVANPNILFLDEVTSGLDAGTDKRMMRLFADLAGDQKTVICVTHTLENIDVCNLVVLLHRGRLVYFGPPGEAPGYFGVARLAEVYELLESEPAEHWAEKFLASPQHETYVAARLSSDSGVRGEATPAHAPAPPRRRWFDWSQTAILMRRYVDLILADKRNLAILLLQAPLIAAVMGMVFDTSGPLLARARAESQVAFMLVLSAIWFGCLNSAREVVKELPVYLRERSVSLGIGPYLTSKLLPLALLAAFQCVVLLAVVSAMVSLPGSFLDRAIALFLAAMGATAMGLAVSAFVDTNDKAVAIVPILLIPQVILSDAVVHLGDAGRAFAKATMVSFWSLDAMKATLSREVLDAKDPMGELLVPRSGEYLFDLGMVAVLGLAFLFVAWLGLRLKDRRG
ncbi:MAG: FHA domain-containing protein [Gammaproteobacteria bacterium]